MSKLAFKTDSLKAAIKSYDGKISPNLKINQKKTIIPFSEENKDLLSFLNEAYPLTKAQKLKISGFLFADEKLGEMETNSVLDLFDKISFIGMTEVPFLELKINNKWYPILCSLDKFMSLGGWTIEINLSGSLGYLSYSKNVFFGDWTFKNKSGETVNKSINEIFESANLRIASKESIEHTKNLIKKIPELNSYAGKMYDASGIGLVYNEMWGFWSDVNIGWKSSPAQVIIEPTLENRYAAYESKETEMDWRLPFVRVFSLKHKSYVYVDIEDLEEHVYCRDGKDKIILPNNIMFALESIFNAKPENIFGDLFHGRHGGIVVLANGPSGVGKTLTAEVFAEYQERPLYCMEMSEIGTNLKEVEANLQKIFARAKKWNTVLLFDEADIFLSERVASDLERSAIVGIFLRLLDYYEGTFFLTTNRGDGIDTAFKSRVTLYLNYPELSNETRLSIWQSMVSSAGLNVEDKSNRWQEIAKTKLNGRQIRNQVRLLKLMYPDNKLSTTDIFNSLEFVAK